MLVKAYHRHGVYPEGLVLHSDNGGPMKGSTMLDTLQRLGAVPSFSRPGVSNDNPFLRVFVSDLEVSPRNPTRPFVGEQDAQRWVDGFVQWYNSEYLHSEIRFVTPDDRHDGEETSELNKRKDVYELAGRRILVAGPDRPATGNRSKSFDSTQRRKGPPNRTSVTKLHNRIEATTILT